MKGDRNPPKRLYKFRSFTNRTLSMLVSDLVFFADPGEFNDPLDTKPKLEVDLDRNALEGILAKLIEDRASAEMSNAARTIRYRGPKTLDHIVRHSRKTAETLLATIRHNATNPEFNVENPEVFLLRQYVEDELLRRYYKGVLSLAERATCPLMWSHYGDQHRGFCLGYSIPEAHFSDVHKIQYGGSRSVKASVVSAMLDGDEQAKREVDNAVLLKKARSWAYEREWRMIGTRGNQDSPLELEEVVFGMRCDPAVMYAVIQALAKRDRSVRFFEIREKRDTFRLAKCPVDIDGLAALLPRRCRVIDSMFDDLPRDPAQQ